MRASILAIVLVACTANHKSHQPEGGAQPPPSDPALPVDSGPAPDPTPPAAGPPSAEAEAASAAPATSGQGGNVEQVPGRGSCTQDADCVLTGYQEGCCTQACHPYATNKDDLAARQAKENCAARTQPCPPPAPCRRPAHRYLAAKCNAGSCVALREPITP